jgi:hypothetical protein
MADGSQGPFALHVPLRRAPRVLFASSLLFASVFGCGGSGNGAPCTTDLDCQSSFACIADPALAGARCMRACEAGVRICDDGAVCLDFAGGRACYPGGRIGFGETCSASLDCEAGTVCPASQRECMQACDGTSPVCVLTERCVTGDAVGPYCAP